MEKILDKLTELLQQRAQNVQTALERQQAYIQQRCNKTYTVNGVIPSAVANDARTYIQEVIHTFDTADVDLYNKAMKIVKDYNASFLAAHNKDVDKQTIFNALQLISIQGARLNNDVLGRILADFTDSIDDTQTIFDAVVGATGLNTDVVKVKYRTAFERFRMLESMKESIELLQECVDEVFQAGLPRDRKFIYGQKFDVAAGLMERPYSVQAAEYQIKATAAELDATVEQNNL